MRIEKTACECGWLPEQLRALGLVIQQSEELKWLTQDWAEIGDREGTGGNSTAVSLNKSWRAIDLIGATVKVHFGNGQGWVHRNAYNEPIDFEVALQLHLLGSSGYHG